jgi:ubiquinone/menaquinone biosynthesis C-methylase UbiE
VLPCKINVYDLPLVENTIDAVFAVYIFHLVNKPEQIVNEIKRVLRNNGKLITLNFDGIDTTENDINNEIEQNTMKRLKEET